jgi:hypothetical protein
MLGRLIVAAETWAGQFRDTGDCIAGTNIGFPSARFLVNADVRAMTFFSSVISFRPLFRRANISRN